jgi:hypothetical protein
MRVKLSILEITTAEYRKVVSSLDTHLSLLGAMGSKPCCEGEIVEHLTVPAGKIWLFPLGNDFQALEKIVSGTRIVKTITIE